MKFSDRIGITKQRNVIQRDGIDETLKNKLWNVFFTYFILPLQNDKNTLLVNTDFYKLFINLWHNYFGKPVDTIPEDKTSAANYLRSYFYECKWYEIYNFIEFVSANHDLFDISKFKDSINIVLEIELSAYRFIGNEIVLVEKEEYLDDSDKAKNCVEKNTAEPDAGINNLKSEAEIRKSVTTEFMLSAIEPFDVENQFDIIPEEEKITPNEIIESTKSVKDKLGLRSEDRDAFLTIKSKPARTTVITKTIKNVPEKNNSADINSDKTIQAVNNEKVSTKNDDESFEKQDELDKAILILRQKQDAKINLGDQ